MDKVKNKSQRDWYAKQAVENGWTNAELEMQIEHDLFSKNGKRV